jgi:putative lipoic acid-binding regulatory protein
MKPANGPEPESPLKFPCVFPIKVMGRHEADFASRVIEIISEHTGPVSSHNIRSRPSSNGRFLAVTVTVIAESRDQLDDIYRSLTAAEFVLFVL